MKYFQWVDMPTEEEVHEKDFLCSSGFSLEDYYDISLLTQGGPIKDWPSDALLEFNEMKDYVLDIIPNILSLFIVSGSLRSFLEDSTGDDELQFLPVKITSKDKKYSIDGYFIVVCLNAINCIDWSRTKHSTLEEGRKEVDSLETLCIDRKRIHRETIFRTKGDDSFTIVSEVVVSKLLSGDFSGLNFKELETMDSLS